jgi:tetratricopeptide (TPR) repeat protein
LYLFQAGVKATRPYKARSLFERALVQLEALPESRGKLEQSLEIRLELRSVLGGLGEARTALQHMREAEVLAEALNDERRRGLVCAHATNLRTLQGELGQALANGTRALAIAEQIGDASLSTMSEIYLTQVHWYRGEYERAVERAAANIAAMPSGPVHFAATMQGPSYLHSYQMISLHSYLIRNLAELGRFAEAAPYAHEVLRLVEPTSGAFGVGMAHIGAGCLLLAKGDWEQARPLVERARAEYRKGNIFLSLPHAVASSARLLAQLGEASEALNRLQEGEELLERRIAGGTIDQAGMDCHWLGRAALLLGRLDDARRLANCSLQYSPSHPGFAAHALHLFGDIAVHPDQFDIEEGEIHYRKALALAEPRGMRPLIAHCQFGLSKLYRRTGKHEQAREHLTAAASMYREMDMRFYLEQAEAET